MTSTASKKVPPTGSAQRPPTERIDLEDGTITHVIVDVVSGLNHPVASVDVAAVYQYPDGPTATTRAVTDPDGRATFHDVHFQHPNSVCFFVANEPCDCYPAARQMSVALEV